MFFKKKDKRYNDHMDNYVDTYANLFSVGAVVILIALVCYGIYQLFV